MLTLLSDHGSLDCERMDRRDFIQAGMLGLGCLSLSWLLQSRANAATTQNLLKDKSVVLLFLSGGASHIETFNPNMDAPAPYCSVTGEVKTTIPGMTFGGTFPELAKHADKMAVVRSFQHPIGGHVQAIAHVLAGGTDPTGRGDAGFSMGSMYTRLRGTNHALTGMPTFALLNSNEVDPQYRNERGRVERGSLPGALGTAYGAFNPSSKNSAVDNMTLHIPHGRLHDRRALLGALDRLKREADAGGHLQGVDMYTQQAFDVVLGSAAEAFDLSKEEPRLVARYDTSMFRVGKKQFRDSMLGRHMLTARRLIESGCGFVTVHSAGWDMHADSNNPGIQAGMEMLGRPLDKAVSAFLADLARRDMSDRVLLIITGDFGRSPKVNDRGGRDHWPRLCTLAFAGGGLNMGQVIGKSARNNDVPASHPISPSNLMATVMHTLFDVETLRVARGVPRELVRLAENQKPIEQLF